MEWPPSRGGFFMLGTPSGTRLAKVMFLGWKDLETGGGVLEWFESHPLRQFITY